jgi:peptide-methionine (R)-S-oxide reductase
MIARRAILKGAAAALAAQTLWRPHPAAAAPAAFAVVHSDSDWRRLLTPDQYDILRRAGTERPFSSALLNEHRQGVFSCAGCRQDNFSSTTKFDSHTGWPSFWAPLNRTAVLTLDDRSLGIDRTEVRCSRCGGHLGHVFDDGPRPTGLRYCMNGLVLTFRSTKA